MRNIINPPTNPRETETFVVGIRCTVQLTSDLIRAKHPSSAKAYELLDPEGYRIGFFDTKLAAYDYAAEMVNEALGTCEATTIAG